MWKIIEWHLSWSCHEVCVGWGEWPGTSCHRSEGDSTWASKVEPNQHLWITRLQPHQEDRPIVLILHVSVENVPSVPSGSHTWDINSKLSKGPWSPQGLQSLQKDPLNVYKDSLFLTRRYMSSPTLKSLLEYYLHWVYLRDKDSGRTFNFHPID